MPAYRGYQIEEERDWCGAVRTVVIKPDGEAYYSDAIDPRSEVDIALDGFDDAYADEHKLRSWQLV